MEFIDPSVYERADEGLRQLIKRAEVGALSEKEYDQYEASMKLLADEIDMEKQGYERGVRQGMEQGMKQGMKQGMEQGMKQGMKQGMEQGMEQGMREKALQIANEMKSLKMPVDVIMKVTHLSQDEIEKL